MKNLKVSRSSHPMTFKKCKNLGELVAVVEKEGEADNLFITQVILNNKIMDEEEEKLLTSLSVNEIESMVFKMATISEIVRETLADTLYAIQSTQSKAIEFAKSFRQNFEVDDEKVKFTLIQCRQIINSLEEIFCAHQNETFLIKHHSLWNEAEKELTNILQCIFQTRKMPGFNMLCDLMEYDLVQALDQWEEVIEKELLENSSLNGIFSLKNQASQRDNEVDA